MLSLNFPHLLYAKQVEATAAFQVGKLVGEPAAVAQELRIRAFTERIALYLSCCDGRIADTEEIDPDCAALR